MKDFKSLNEGDLIRAKETASMPGDIMEALFYNNNLYFKFPGNADIFAGYHFDPKDFDLIER